MLKLPLLIALLASCDSTGRLDARADVTHTAQLEKRLVLQASDQPTAVEALAIVHLFCPTKQMKITGQEQGLIVLSFCFSINAPQRFRQMMEHLAELPGIIVLQQR